MLGFVNPALVLARELDSDFLVSAAHNARGVVFRMSALRHKAVEEFETALALTTSNRNRHVLMHNLGELYLFNNQLEIARDTFETALEWSERNDEPHRAHVARMNLADTLMRLGDLDRAEAYLRVSLANEQLGTGRGRAAVLLGEALATRGEHERALERYDESLELEPNHPDHRRRVGLRKVESLEALGRRDEARALLQDVAWEPSGDAAPEGLLLLQDLRRHAALWNQMGEPAKAYAAERHATELQDRIEGRETAARLDILRVEAEAQKRRQDLVRARAEEAELRRRVQLNHFTWAAALGGISILFLVGYLQSSRIHQRRLAQERQRQTKRLEALVQLRTAELEMEVEQRLQSQEERRKAERRLAESDRLRALGQLTGGVAHDFNNLLTVMMSAAEIIREDASGSKDVKELAQSILHATESGQSITRDLLTYAGKQRLAPEVLRLDQHVTSLRTLLNHAVAENATLAMKVEPVSARLDPGLLTTAILNLVRNAVEASERGSTIVIEVTSREASDEGYVVVRDEGVGMTTEEIRQACEPFYTNKTTAVASGLGLSMVYGFVTQSGGRLQIDSTPGRGTEITLAWPRWQPEELVEDLRPEMESFGTGTVVNSSAEGRS
ncbi:MAG: ATP-binding protein [Myxococcota bacterium]